MSIFQEMGVREGKDRINEEVVYTVAQAYAILDQAISRFLAGYDLTPAKFNMLLVIKHIGEADGMPQNEISQRLLVTTSNITRMIDKLEKDKYVQRLAKQGDRRVNLIKITPKGVKRLDEIWPDYKSMVDNLVGGYFSDREKKTISALLNKIL